MQWLIPITSFLGKCDFINYHKCAMFANTVPWEQGAVDDKCGGRLIADEICWAGGSRCARRQGVHGGKGCGLLAVWDGAIQISAGHRCMFWDRTGGSAGFVPMVSSTSPEHAVLLYTRCQHPEGFPGPAVFLAVLLFPGGWYCGATRAKQQRRSLLWWWCPALCPAVLDGNGEPLGSSVEWGAPAAGGTCPMLGWWKVLGTAELREPWNICTGDGVFSQSQGMPPAHAW